MILMMTQPTLVSSYAAAPIGAGKARRISGVPVPELTGLPTTNLLEGVFSISTSPCNAEPPMKAMVISNDAFNNVDDDSEIPDLLNGLKPPAAVW